LEKTYNKIKNPALTNFFQFNFKDKRNPHSWRSWSECYYMDHCSNCDWNHHHLDISSMRCPPCPSKVGFKTFFEYLHLF